MSPTGYFPLDIESAKIYGIAKWQKEFFWPVSYQSYKEIEAQIKQALNKLIQDNINNELSELLLINYKIFLEYTNFLYSLLVLKEVYRNGLRPVYSGSSINFKGIIENGIPLKRILTPPSIGANSFIKQIRAKLTSIKVNLILSNSLTAFLKKPLKPADFVTDPSLISGSLLPEYIRRRLNGGIKLKTTQDWYSMSDGIRLSQNQKDKVYLLCKNLVQQVEQIAIGYDLKLTKLQHKYLAVITVELLLPTMICLQALKKYIFTLKPLHLLIGSSGNHFARMLSFAVRATGGTVTGFKHGEPAIYLSDYYSWLELSTVDRFMTYTEHSARAIESVLNIYPALRANQVKIEGAATRIFYNFWQSQSKKPLSKRVERVMVVAKSFKLDNRISYGHALPQLMQLDLELRIVNILKKSGYKVIYKYHPDSDLPSDITGFFSSKGEVVSEPFEEVMDYADGFLFYHSNSTTFGPALCTNKPIIYINNGWEVWSPQVYELIAKRCRIVSAHFDERNRFIVNEEELLNALAYKPLEPNLEFANKYMFP